MLKTRVSPFEYEVLKRLKSLDIEWAKQRLLVACSGGRDSAALLKILVSLRSRLKFAELAVAHIHHGTSANTEIVSYRKKAAVLTKKLAKQSDAKFFMLEHSGRELSSEADFRKVREALLENCRAEQDYDWIVFAHHADDLLETRLIRLIRGTGAQGLQSMNLNHGKKLRPLLVNTAAQISTYAADQKLQWIEDPTNCENEYLRNWIRNLWLPMLETKRSGARQSLARSFEQISDTLSHQPEQAGLQVIKRKEFANLSRPAQREMLARVMLERGARDFSRRQIDEILKRVSVNRRTLTFEVGGLQWRVNAEQIEAVRL